MPEEGTDPATQQPAPEEPPSEPSKIEIIPLEPKRIIKRYDNPLPTEQRSDEGGSDR
jgi:hypothetical protein